MKRKAYLERLMGVRTLARACMGDGGRVRGSCQQTGAHLTEPTVWAGQRRRGHSSGSSEPQQPHERSRDTVGLTDPAAFVATDGQCADAPSGRSHLVDDPPPCSWPPEGQITLALLSERLGKRLSKEALQKLVAAMGFTVGTAPDGSRVKL
jgi:hypothetical protein